MKLNLLPTYVSKEGQSRTAWAVSGLLALGSIAAAVFLISSSSARLKAAREEVTLWEQKAADALATGKKADEIIAKATTVDRNLKLATAMNEHNAVYPNLYGEVMRYVPSFYRVTSMTAAPNGANACTVTLTGQMKSYQQYADVVLALLRIPDAINVSRAGYNLEDPLVPSLNETDQVGAPIKPGETNLPSDPMERMNEIIARANSEPTGFQDVNGFGTDAPVKGPMPGWSTVTLNITLARNIQTPNPMATLRAGLAGGAGGAGAPAGGTPAGFQPPAPPAGGGGGGRGPENDEDN